MNNNIIGNNVKKFCVECGQQFTATNNLVRLCPICAEEHKQIAKEKQRNYVRERSQRLGITNISIYKTDKEILLAMASKGKTTMAEVLKKLLASIK